LRSGSVSGNVEHVQHLEVDVIALLDVLVGLGMVVIVPTALGLVGVPRTARLLWSGCAALGATALWLPRGGPATALTLPYLVAASALAGHAVRDAVRPPAGGSGRTPLVRLCTAGALSAPMIAATALTAERAGYPLFGFEPIVLRLTVAHFHYAAVIAVLVAGLVQRAAPQAHRARAGAVGVPLGVLLVAVGFFTDDVVELLGATVLTAAMWLVGLAVLGDVRPAVTDRTSRALLLVAALVPVLTMALAVSWALGRATGLPHPALSWMIATHGSANALGFAGCAVLAWYRLRGEAERAADRVPDGPGVPA
jgi:hypothetical protein